MNGRIYVPQPGTLPARAIAYLSTLNGEAVSHAALAEALDFSDPSFTGYFKAAVSHGALAYEKRGRLAFWKIGSNVPPAPKAIPDDEHDDEPIVQRVVAAGVAKAWLTSDSVQLESAPPSLSPKLRLLTPKPIAEAAPAAFRCGLWSDGTLEVQRSSGESFMFSQDEVLELAKFTARWHTKGDQA